MSSLSLEVCKEKREGSAAENKKWFATRTCNGIEDYGSTMASARMQKIDVGKPTELFVQSS